MTLYIKWIEVSIEPTESKNANGRLNCFTLNIPTAISEELQLNSIMANT